MPQVDYDKLVDDAIKSLDYNALTEDALKQFEGANQNVMTVNVPGKPPMQVYRPSSEPGALFPPSAATQQVPGTEQPSVFDQPKSLGETVVQEGFVNPAKQAWSQFTQGGANLMHLGANLTQAINQDLTDMGLGPAEQRKVLTTVENWFRGQQAGGEQAAAQLAGGRTDFPSQFNRALAGGVANAPVYVAAGATPLGPIAGMAAIGGLENVNQGPAATVKGMAKGAAYGTVMHVMGPAGRPMRITGNTALAYTQAKQEGASDEEALAAAITGGIMGEMGPGGGPGARYMAKNIPKVPENVLYGVGALPFRNVRNPLEQKAVNYFRREDIPLTASQLTGNRFLQATEASVGHTPMGAQAAQEFRLGTEEGIVRKAGELASEVHPEPVTPYEAGKTAAGALQQQIEQLNPQIDESYRQAWSGVGKPEFVERVVVGRKPVLDANGKPTGRTEPVYRDIEMPVDVRWMQEYAKREIPLFKHGLSRAQRSASRAYSILNEIVKGDGVITAQQAEKVLGALKEESGKAESPELRDVAQGTAAHLISELQKRIDDAVAKTGQEAVEGLRAGRKMHAEKMGIAEVADLLRDEPVETFGQLTRERDAGYDRLKKVEELAPGIMPQLGRAFLDKLFELATREGGWTRAKTLFNQWENLGDKTKRLLFPNELQREALDRFFFASKMVGEIINPSGTAMVQAAQKAGLNPFRWAEGWVGSKLLFTPKGIKFLTGVAQNPPRTAAESARVKAQAEKIFGPPREPGEPPEGPGGGGPPDEPPGGGGGGGIRFGGPHELGREPSPGTPPVNPPGGGEGPPPPPPPAGGGGRAAGGPPQLSLDELAENWHSKPFTELSPDQQTWIRNLQQKANVELAAGFGEQRRENLAFEPQPHDRLQQIADETAQELKERQSARGEKEDFLSGERGESAFDPEDMKLMLRWGAAKMAQGLRDLDAWRTAAAKQFPNVPADELEKIYRQAIPLADYTKHLPAPAGEPVSPLKPLQPPEIRRGGKLEGSLHYLRRAEERKPGVGGPDNERIVFRDKDGEFVVGKITAEDWVKRVNKNLSPEELKEARRWYAELEAFFEKEFGKEEAPKLMMAWLSSQQNVSPSGGMMNVNRARDILRGMPREKVAGLAEAKILAALQGKIPEEGYDAKLMDFVDSALGKTTRTWMGDDPRGGQPSVIDVWANRDVGKVDKKVLDYLTARFGAKAVRKLILDGASIGETDYEYGSRFYNRLLETLNKSGYDGGGWKGMEVQAVGWVGMQKAMGDIPEFAQDLISKNTRRYAFEVDPGEGAPILQQYPWHTLSTEQQAKVTEHVGTRVTDLAAKLTDARITNRKVTRGAYLGKPTISVEMDVFGSPETFRDFSRAAAYLGQQSEVWYVRPLKSGKSWAYFIRGEKGLDTPEVQQKFWEKLRDKVGPDLVPGYSPLSGEMAGSERGSGIYIINPFSEQYLFERGKAGLKSLSTMRYWTAKDKAKIDAAINEVESEMGLELRIGFDKVDLGASMHNWARKGKENGHLRGLTKTGRSSIAERLRDLSPESLQSWWREAWEQSGAGTGTGTGTEGKSLPPRKGK